MQRVRYITFIVTIASDLSIVADQTSQVNQIWISIQAFHCGRPTWSLLLRKATNWARAQLHPIRTA